MKLRNMSLAAVIALLALWECGTTYQGGSGGHSHIAQKARAADVKGK